MKKKVIKILITIILISFWIFGLVFLNQSGVLSVKEAVDVEYINFRNQLYADSKITGKINSSENGFSTLYFKFNNVNRVDYKNENILQFRIRELSDKQWLVVNNYRSGVIQLNHELPVGFLPFENSKNKEYIFEFESLNGNKANLVSVEKNERIKLLYKPIKQEVISSPSNFYNFIYKKILGSLSDINLISESFIFAIPLCVYLIFVVGKFNKKKQRFLGVFVTFFLIVDIFYIEQNNFGISALVLMVLMFLIFKYHLFKFLFFIAFAIFFSWVLLTLLNFDDYQIKLNFWMYMIFLLISIGLVFEEFTNKKKKFSYGNVFDEKLEIFRAELYSKIDLNKLIKNKIVLDLGCGYGPDAINFTKYAKKVIGIDIDKHKEWKEIKNDKLSLIKANSGKIPFKNNYFDVVFLKDLLHHIDKVDETLQEINRVTKKNGKIIIVEGNRYNPFFYIFVTKVNGHEHFTQFKFEEYIKNNFKEYKIVKYNIYPPFFVPKKIYKLFVPVIRFTNRLSFLQKIFSYNIALVTKYYE